MDTVVDTNVIAYAMLPAEPASSEAREALANAGRIVVPDLLRAELANVLWQWVRVRDVPVEAGVQMLADADALLDEVVSAGELWAEALRLAAVSAHSPYDTLFVALARMRGTHVITFDRRLAAVFPDDAQLLA